MWIKVACAYKTNSEATKWRILKIPALLWKCIGLSRIKHGGKYSQSSSEARGSITFHIVCEDNGPYYKPL